MTTVTFAHRNGNVGQNIDASVALYECVGVQIATSLPDMHRPCMLDITRVVHLLSAAKTQLSANLNTGAECTTAFNETRDSVSIAENNLCSFVRDYVGVYETFAAMYNHGEKYQAIGTKMLWNVYWLGEANHADSAASICPELAAPNQSRRMGFTN
ncbi:unnamed protein product [Phytophthora lilii]|uniref:Unnamed protein product n=1 Tax=Phytophthora lilii TaxID=2077276 RepID=A0A9W6XIE0_9STRA|nr:unnamed protein product [Phytophthora lilii]